LKSLRSVRVSRHNFDVFRTALGRLVRQESERHRYDGLVLKYIAEKLIEAATQNFDYFNHEARLLVADTFLYFLHQENDFHRGDDNAFFEGVLGACLERRMGPGPEVIAAIVEGLDFDDGTMFMDDQVVLHDALCVLGKFGTQKHVSLIKRYTAEDSGETKAVRAWANSAIDFIRANASRQLKRCQTRRPWGPNEHYMP